MLRFLIWSIVYVLSLGFASIKVRYSDGLEIDFKPLWGKQKKE